MSTFILERFVRYQREARTETERKRYERLYMRDIKALPDAPLVRARDLEEHQHNDWAVYFVLAPLLGRVKIGVTRNPAKRFARLCECSSEQLEFLGWVPGGRAVERQLHLHFAEDRAYGEWFNLSVYVRQRLSTCFGLTLEDPLFT